MADTASTIRIGPADHGRRMSLDDFRDAEAIPGYNYELARGVIDVVHIPGGVHGDVVAIIRRKLDRYWDDHLDQVRFIAGGAECRIEAPVLVSERHPDCAVYLSPRPPVDPPWKDWIPEIAVEVVSASSRHRDYHEKRDEYLAIGIREYWIVDPQKSTMLVLTRRGAIWNETLLDGRGVYRTPLLPEFELHLEEVFSNLEVR